MKNKVDGAKELDILLLEPYFTGSHKSWANSLREYSVHNIHILSMSGSFWKWRMHGAAVTFADRFLSLNLKPDLILATDMLDLSTFLALTRNETAHIPTAVYFHENQLNYPWSPKDRDKNQGRDHHYPFINFTTALTADALIFNSQFHKKAFLDSLPRFLGAFPDNQLTSKVNTLIAKSSVLPVGIDLHQQDLEKVQISNDSPLNILWNHRWEHDKNPEEFLNALRFLRSDEADFRLTILGEDTPKTPPVFTAIQREFSDKILHFGYLDEYQDYLKAVKAADILPVTSLHDFFGVSVVEAMLCGVYPLLPNRLAYPEHLNPKKYPENYYEHQKEFHSKLLNACRDPEKIRQKSFSNEVLDYQWRIISPKYDNFFVELANQFS